MSRSTPPRKIPTSQVQIGLLLLLLSAISVLMTFQRPAAQVTVSGLTLDTDRAAVMARLGEPNFQEGHPQPTALEYWSDPVNLEPSLSLEFNPDGRMKSVRGGRPEIDGENVRGWSLVKVERALGSADGASRGQSLGSGGSLVDADAFLRYHDRHLLVCWNAESGIDFVLFAGIR